MCGIFAIFSKFGQAIEPRTYYGTKHTLREIAFRQSGKQRHRGPDDTGVHVLHEHGVVMVHERMGVVGVQTGHQPFFSENGNFILIANGEIYNYLELAAVVAKKRKGYLPKNDCDVIIELYQEHGERLIEFITGMFAFVLYDKCRKVILMARDALGIIPMYIGEDKFGNIWISSEMKCIADFCPLFEVFPPGEVRTGPASGLKRRKYFEKVWISEIPTMKADLSLLRQKLESAVLSHMHCEVPFGALLSGGVDSSLIASIVTKLNREKDPSFRLKTFSVGLRNAPDFTAAKKVADYIGSIHTELTFEIDDALDNIRDIIYHLETYDVTTVRCSIPMFLLTRYIKSTGIKMVLSGEGADELFGGYLYFFKAPDVASFHSELVTRIQQLHLSDCLRANKTSMAKGLELRVPFLDDAFVDYVMSIRPEDKIPGHLNFFNDEKKYRIEKHILREAFCYNYLPDEILWRQKEQFSDGVGYAWIDCIRQIATARVSDEEFEIASIRYPINTPTSKEAYYYRTIFEEQFPGEAAARTVKRWVPRMDWGCAEDPSGRAQTIHESSK